MDPLDVLQTQTVLGSLRREISSLPSHHPQAAGGAGQRCHRFSELATESPLMIQKDVPSELLREGARALTNLSFGQIDHGCARDADQ